jgi:hypothetical protein
MSDAVSITGRLDLVDVLNIRLCRKRLEMRPSIRWLIVLMSAFIATIIVWAVIRDGFRLGFGVILLACLYFPFGGLWLDRRATISHFRQHEEDYEEHTAEIGTDTVTTRSATASTSLAWKHVGLVADTSAGLLFVSHELTTWFWLPSRILTASDRQQILTFAHQNRTPVRAIPLTLFR